VLPSVFATLLSLLSIALECQADPFGLAGARMWRLLPVTLNAASSQLRSRGAVFWVHPKLLVCGLHLSPLFHFSFSFFFVLCLSYLLSVSWRVLKKKKNVLLKADTEFWWSR
jgi:hypothetical protein